MSCQVMRHPMPIRFSAMNAGGHRDRKRAGESSQPPERVEARRTGQPVDRPRGVMAVLGLDHTRLLDHGQRASLSHFTQFNRKVGAVLPPASVVALIECRTKKACLRPATVLQQVFGGMPLSTMPSARNPPAMVGIYARLNRKVEAVPQRAERLQVTGQCRRRMLIAPPMAEAPAQTSLSLPRRRRPAVERR